MAITDYQPQRTPEGTSPPLRLWLDTEHRRIALAIKQLVSDIAGAGVAADITYDNASSGLSATDVQAAIDEIEALVNDISSGGAINRRLTLEYFYDFDGAIDGTGTIDGWDTGTGATTGAGVSVSASSDGSNPGWWAFTTGTNSGGQAYAFRGQTAGTLYNTTGGWQLDSTPLTIEADFVTSVLADVTNQFAGQIGLSNDADGTNDRIYMTAGWDSGAGAMNWSIISNNAGGATQQTFASTGPTAGVKHHLRMEVTSTQAELFVDGVSVVTHNAGIPTAGDLYPTVRIAKAAGTTSRSFAIGFYWLYKTLSSARYASMGNGP